MMTKGEYYVGDLCYVMTPEEWDEVCSLTIKGNECLEGEFQLADGRRFAMYGTKYGDGLYFDGGKLYEFSVDSGTIGCFLTADIKAKKYDNISDLGAIVNFEFDFRTSGSREEGWIQIGKVAIDTDPQQEEDEEYEEEF